MGRVRASCGTPKNLDQRARKACVRVGEEGVQSGRANSHAHWLTIEEAQLLALSLDVAIRKAKAFSPNYPPPEPPQANAAQQEAA